MADNEFQFKISSAFLFADNVVTNPTPLDPGVIFDEGRFNYYHFKSGFNFETNVLVDPNFSEYSLTSNGTGAEYLQQGTTIEFVYAEGDYKNLVINNEGNLFISCNNDTEYEYSFPTYYLPLNNLSDDYQYIRITYRLTGSSSDDDVYKFGNTDVLSLGSSSQYNKYMRPSTWNIDYMQGTDEGWVTDEIPIAWVSSSNPVQLTFMNADFLRFSFDLNVVGSYNLEIKKIWCWNPPGEQPFLLDWWYNLPEDVPDILIDEYNYPYIYDSTITGEGLLPSRSKDLTDEIPYYWDDGDGGCGTTMPWCWYRDVKYTIPLYTLGDQLSENYRLVARFRVSWASKYDPSRENYGSLGGTLYLELINSSDTVVYYTTGQFGRIYGETIGSNFEFRMFGGVDSFYIQEDYKPKLQDGLLYVCGVVVPESGNCIYGGATFPLSKLSDYNVKLGTDWYTPIAKSNIYFATGAYDPLNVPSGFNFSTNMIIDSCYDYPEETINSNYLSDVDTGSSFHLTYADYDLGDTVTIDPTYNSIRIRHWYDGIEDDSRYGSCHQYLLTPILNIYRRYEYINIRYIIVADNYEQGDSYYASNVKFRFYGRNTDNNPPTVTQLDYYYECTATNQWVTVSIPISDLNYTYVKNHADMIGIEVEYYHSDGYPLYVDVLVDQIWGSDEQPSPVPGPTPPTPPILTPEWWINSRGVDPTHAIPQTVSYGIDRPFATQNSGRQSYSLNCNVTSTSSSYDLGIDGGQEVEIFREDTIHDIPLYDSNNQLSTYKIRFSYGEYMDSTEEQWEPYASISLYNGDTYIPYVGNSGYIETDTYAVQQVTVFAGADTFYGNDGQTAHILYGGFVLILDYYNSEHFVKCAGGGIDLDWLETTYGVHLGDDWLT